MKWTRTAFLMPLFAFSVCLNAQVQTTTTVTKGPKLPVKPPQPTAPAPPAGCLGYEGQIEMKNGESKTLQDLCILNYRSMPGPTPSVALNLKDGSNVEVPLDNIKDIRVVGLTQTPIAPSVNGVYADVHVTLRKSKKELDGQTTGFLTTNSKGATDPRLTRNADDPFVLIGRTPNLM